jgi:hypothetical protein
MKRNNIKKIDRFANLNTKEIFGIVGGIIAFLILVAISVYYFFRNRDPWAL